MWRLSVDKLVDQRIAENSFSHGDLQGCDKLFSMDIVSLLEMLGGNGNAWCRITAPVQGPRDRFVISSCLNMRFYCNACAMTISA